MNDRKIIIVTHGNLASGFKSSLKVIMGDIDLINNIETVEIQGDTANEDVVSQVKELVLSYEKDVFILTDIIIGSSTTNSILAVSELNRDNIYIVSGINLSLILAILTMEGGKDIKSKINEIIDQNKDLIVYLDEDGDDIDD